MMDPHQPSVLVERDGRIATLTLHRPEVHNAVNLPMLEHLEAELDRLAAEPPWAIILRAATPGFCAGIDLKESRDATPEFARRRVTTMHRVLRKLRRLPVPVIAAVDGVAAGLGCELVISADLRVASATSRLGYPEPRVGVPSPSHHLIWLIGLARAQDLLLTARWVEGHEAAQIGLVTLVAPDPEHAARKLAEHVTTLAPFSIAQTKENIWRAIDGGADAATEHHIEGVYRAASTHDRREALAAFAAKRAPRFTGS
jgi:enoyl-CoA hydratase/carnithine racemase